jgi:hypothetical protein
LPNCLGSHADNPARCFTSCAFAEMPLGGVQDHEVEFEWEGLWREMPEGFRDLHASVADFSVCAGSSAAAQFHRRPAQINCFGIFRHFRASSGH